jgi:hypothetical protein
VPGVKRLLEHPRAYYLRAKRIGKVFLYRLLAADLGRLARSLALNTKNVEKVFHKFSTLWLKIGG